MKTLLILASLPLILSYPNGVPPPYCHSMFPYAHYADSQASAPPFEILVNQSTYRPGGYLTVTFKLKDNTSIPYMGVFLQARIANCDKSLENYNRAVGYFSLTKALKQQFYTMRCNVDTDMGGCGDTICHKSADIKNKPIELPWQAPSEYVGHIYFRATFVTSLLIYWTNVKSEVVRQEEVNMTIPTPEICPTPPKFRDVFGYDLPDVTTPVIPVHTHPTNVAAKLGLASLAMLVSVFVAIGLN